MARRFTRITTLGQCSIILDGVAFDPPRRARLAQQVVSGHIFVVSLQDGIAQTIRVTSLPTIELLTSLSDYAWQMPTWLESDDSPDGVNKE
jgi:hypothetical protein